MKTLILYLPKIAILFCFFINANVNGQIYLVEEWVQTSGMPDTIDYSASKVDGSGNIYVTTNTISATEKANILTTKYNSSGVVQWEVEKDNADENDYGSAIEVDGSGNVYVGAVTWVDGTNKYDYLVIKYNSSGTQQWVATYNGPGNFYDIPTDIYVDGSGNVYVTGYSYGSTTLGDFCTIKYNSSGTAQWTSRYDYASDQDAAAIVRSGPGSTVVVIGASENTPGDWDFAAVQYNTSTGAQVNTNRNSASGSGFDQVYSADVDASGNIYISGRSAVVDEGFNMRTVKLEPDLDLVWAKNHDHAELDDEAHGVIVDLADNVYVTGWVTNENLSKSMLTIKYNSAGTLQWYKIEDGVSPNLNVTGLKISSIDYDNIVVAGNIDNGQSLDFLTVIYNSDGDKLWVEQYDSPNKDDDKVNFVKADIDGVFYVGGKSYGISAASNRLIKYTSYDLITPPDDDIEHPTTFTYFENKGQIIDNENEIRDDIKFYTHRVEPSLYFSDESMSYVWAKVDTTDDVDTITRIDMSFVNANTSLAINRAISQGGVFMNYYLPQCPDGVTNVRSSDRLIVPNIYDNVDLQYYFDGGGLKYYIIINPGWSEQSDPISIFYNGAEDVNILGGGELQIIGALGEIVQAIPEAYQIDEYGDIVPLAWDADYIQIDDFEIGFDLETYDDGIPLVIEIKMDGLLGGAEDCVDNVIWGTWFGGNKNDLPTDVEMTLLVDGLPSLYVAGVTTTTAFPADLLVSYDYSGGMSDIFLEKFSGEGDLYKEKWGTVLGGSDNEQYVLGTPEGPKLTTFNGGTEIIFVGTTYSDDLDEICKDFSTANSNDQFDNTLSSTADGIAGFLNYDDGTIGWLTYIGGHNDPTYLFGVDSYDNEIVIVGQSHGGNTGMASPENYLPDDFETDGTNIIYGSYPSTNTSGIVIELNGRYESKFETLFGTGNSADQIRDVIIDKTAPSYFGKYPYYIIGQGAGDDLQETDGVFQETRGGSTDAFIAKFVPDPVYENARDLEFCTYYGGAGGESGLYITLDNDKNVYITGATKDYGVDLSENLPTECPVDVYCEEEQLAAEIYYGTYLAKFNPSATELLYGSYFGGVNSTYPYDLVSDGDYIIMVGYTLLDGGTFPMWDYDGAYFDDFSEEPDDNAAFIALWDKDMNNLWSTYLGDDAWSRAAGANVFEYGGRRELYVVGSVQYNDEFNTFRPLCNDELPDAYFEPEGNPSYYSQYDGYITAFDLSIFEPFLVGITNPNLQSNLILFPNPSFSELNIVSENEIENIVIYDMLGHTVLNISDINQNFLQLDVTLLSSGYYTVEVNQRGKKAHSKFIKN